MVRPTFVGCYRRHGTRVDAVGAARLALPPDDFEKTSVALPDSVWSERFRCLLQEYPPGVLPAPGEGDEFAANAAMIRRAKELAPPAELYIALVWDERPAGGPGGTGDFADLADLARRFDAPLAIINPTKL